MHHDQHATHQQKRDRLLRKDNRRKAQDEGSDLKQNDMQSQSLWLVIWYAGNSNLLAWWFFPNNNGQATALQVSAKMGH